VNSNAFPNLEAELERSREEILKLAERVHRLVAKRNEREMLVQRLRRTAAGQSFRQQTPTAPEPLHLCSLCATDHASEAIDHVRGCAPGSKCDQCGQPAVMWIQLKPRETLARY
jgi:hypothetical protein